jgi:hypothetical protein
MADSPDLPDPYFGGNLRAIRMPEFFLRVKLLKCLPGNEIGKE